MVILHVASLRDYLYSGVCAVVPQYVREQQKANTNVALLNILDDRIKGIEHQFKWDKEKKFEAIPAPFDKPDLVIFHEVYCKEFCKIARELVNKGIPYVIVPHGSLIKQAQRRKGLKKFIANHTLFYPYLKNATAIQVLSEMERKETRWGKKKILIPNGVDPVQEHKTSFRKDRFRLLYIGRLEIQMKGLDLLIAAINKEEAFLKEKGCTIEIHGTGGERLKELIQEACVGDLVRLEQPISGEEKKQAYLNADYFIQTSRVEGLPLSILEAMSYGLPCIITEGTCFGDVFRKRNAGWVADTNVSSIADTLKKALEEAEQLPKKSKNCMETIKEEFTWEIVTKKALQEYSHLWKNQ